MKYDRIFPIFATILMMVVAASVYSYIVDVKPAQAVKREYKYCADVPGMGSESACGTKKHCENAGDVIETGAECEKVLKPSKH